MFVVELLKKVFSFVRKWKSCHEPQCAMVRKKQVIILTVEMFSRRKILALNYKVSCSASVKLKDTTENG